MDLTESSSWRNKRAGQGEEARLNAKECDFQEQETGVEWVMGVEGEDYWEVSFQGEHKENKRLERNE